MKNMRDTTPNNDEERNVYYARLATSAYLTTALGGLVTRTVNMQYVSTVLDVACSDGGWALDLARNYPRIHVTGIDKNEQALNEATRFARFHGISNVTFLPTETTLSLHFKNNTFDLIRMRASRFLYDLHFNNMLEEYTRILRPGGWLNFIVFEPGVTSSLAFDKLFHLFNNTIKKEMSGAISDVGTAMHLYDMLLDADFLDVSYTVHALDFSPHNMLGARAFLDERLHALSVVKPLVCSVNEISASEYDELLTQAREDMKQPYTCGYAYLISVVGCKNG